MDSLNAGEIKIIGNIVEFIQNRWNNVEGRDSMPIKTQQKKSGMMDMECKHCIYSNE